MPTAVPPPRTRKKPPVAPVKISRRTRQEHAQETAQDYVELIADLIAQTGEARVIDMARSLGITHVTVARTLQRLQREGLVTSLPYRSIFLTDAGRALSTEARKRHEIVVAFLRSLGVSEEAAQSDAEGIEHHVSEETLAAFVTHLQPGAAPKRTIRAVKEAAATKGSCV